MRSLGRKVKQIFGRISYQGHVIKITVWRIARVFTDNKFSPKNKKVSLRLLSFFEKINLYFSVHHSEKIVLAPKSQSHKIVLHSFFAGESL